MKIKDLKAREILDSRGNPTVEVDMYLEDNTFSRSSVPSGASTGFNEALELRDKDDRYMGKGVMKAVDNINQIIRPNIKNKNFNQRSLDDYLISLDGTPNKSNLGANAILAVSLAFLKAQAKSSNKDLYQYVGVGTKMPIIMVNVINGGMHADNKLDFQEFMIVPQNKDINESIRMASEIFHNLKIVLKENEYSTNVGDEGGFAPNLKTVEEALDLIMASIKKAGYKPKKEVSIAIDVAASTFYDKETSLYNFNNKRLNSDEMIEYYKTLISNYPIISIEDPLDENDFEGFKTLTKRVGKKVMLVGDDVFTTNKKLLQKGIDNKICNSILIKANQIGTVTETLETISLAKENNYKCIISHRSGETEDTFITHLAVGLGADMIKTGSMSRGERICKYNELMRISELINNK